MIESLLDAIPRDAAGDRLNASPRALPRFPPSVVSACLTALSRLASTDACGFAVATALIAEPEEAKPEPGVPSSSSGSGGPGLAPGPLRRRETRVEALARCAGGGAADSGAVAGEALCWTRASALAAVGALGVLAETVARDARLAVKLARCAWGSERGIISPRGAGRAVARSFFSRDPFSFLDERAFLRACVAADRPLACRSARTDARTDACRKTTFWGAIEPEDLGFEPTRVSAPLSLWDGGGAGSGPGFERGRRSRAGSVSFPRGGGFPEISTNPFGAPNASGGTPPLTTREAHASLGRRAFDAASWGDPPGDLVWRSREGDGGARATAARLFRRVATAVAATPRGAPDSDSISMFESDRFAAAVEGLARMAEPAATAASLATAPETRDRSPGGGDAERRAAAKALLAVAAGLFSEPFAVKRSNNTSRLDALAFRALSAATRVEVLTDRDLREGLRAVFPLERDAMDRSIATRVAGATEAWFRNVVSDAATDQNDGLADADVAARRAADFVDAFASRTVDESADADFDSWLGPKGIERDAAASAMVDALAKIAAPRLFFPGSAFSSSPALVPSARATAALGALRSVVKASRACADAAARGAGFDALADAVRRARAVRMRNRTRRFRDARERKDERKDERPAIAAEGLRALFDRGVLDEPRVLALLSPGTGILEALANAAERRDGRGGEEDVVGDISDAARAFANDPNVFGRTSNASEAVPFPALCEEALRALAGFSPVASRAVAHARKEAKRAKC